MVDIIVAIAWIPVLIVLSGLKHLSLTDIHRCMRGWSHDSPLSIEKESTMSATETRVAFSKKSVETIDELSAKNVNWILFVGHSRIREIFEQMVDQLGLEYLTNYAVSGHAIPFISSLLPNTLMHLNAPESTCLGAMQKPRESRKTDDAWCSRIASDLSNELILEFRWRNAGIRFAELMNDLAFVCHWSNICPDYIFLIQGLHFTVTNPLGNSLTTFKRLINRILPSMTLLLDKNVKVVWMLEHGSNPGKWADSESLNDDMITINALVMEMLATMEPRAIIWSSELKHVSNFYNRVCPFIAKNISSDLVDASLDKKACKLELYHVGPTAKKGMIEQLLNYFLNSR